MYGFVGFPRGKKGIKILQGGELGNRNFIGKWRVKFFQGGEVGSRKVSGGEVGIKEVSRRGNGE